MALAKKLVLVELMEQYLQIKLHKLLTDTKQENNPERSFSDWLNNLK